MPTVPVERTMVYTVRRYQGKGETTFLKLVAAPIEYFGPSHVVVAIPGEGLCRLGLPLADYSFWRSSVEEAWKAWVARTEYVTAQLTAQVAKNATLLRQVKEGLSQC